MRAVAAVVISDDEKTALQEAARLVDSYFAESGADPTPVRTLVDSGDAVSHPQLTRAGVSLLTTAEGVDGEDLEIIRRALTIVEAAVSTVETLNNALDQVSTLNVRVLG